MFRAHHPPGMGRQSAHRPCREGKNTKAQLKLLLRPPVLLTSVRSVLPLLVLFVFLLAGTLRAEPLHLFWWCRHYPDAGPVVPVVTVVTADHRTPIIRFVTPRTDPDLISPLVSDHVSADSLSHHTPHGRLGASCCRQGRSQRWHQSGARCCLGQEWQRQWGGVHVHRDCGWCGRRCLGSIQRRCWFSLRG